MTRVHVAVVGLGVLAATLTAAVGEIVRVSIPRDGTPVAAGPPSISGDGRLVAFTSRANLTARDVGGVRQLYVRDLERGVTHLASSTTSGQPANADVDEDPTRALHGLSVDGRYAVFSAVATNLVVSDRNVAGRDVFRKDLTTGEILLVDRSGSGEQATVGVLGQASISGDGNRIAFASGAATNLIPEDTNAGNSDILVRDVRLATTALASRSEAGAQSSGDATNPRISGDGRVVAFDADSRSDSLTPTDTNGSADVIVRDLPAGLTRLASVATDGSQPGGATVGALSADGQQIVFTSDRSYDRDRDTNGLTDVYMARPFASSGAGVLISRASSGMSAGNGRSDAPSLTADGSRIAFASGATDIVPADTNAAASDVIVATAGIAVRESTRLDGSQLARGASQPVLAANGSRLVFRYADGSPSVPFVPGDDDDQPDIFARARAATDQVPPTLDLAPLGVTSAAVRVTGRANDPSGVIALTVNGRPAVLDTGGSFSVRVSRPVASIRVVARDGSGNGVERFIDAPESVYDAPVGGAAVTVSQLTAVRYGRLLRIRYLLDRPARVTVQLLRRTAATKGTKAAWVPVLSRPTAAVPAGINRVRLGIGRLPAGVYQVRVRAASTAIRQATKVLLIPAKTSR